MDVAGPMGGRCRCGEQTGSSRLWLVSTGTRVAWAGLCLGTGAGALLAALQMSGAPWVVPVLYIASVGFLAAGIVVLLWPRLRRLATPAERLAFGDPRQFDPSRLDGLFWGKLAGTSTANVFGMYRAGILVIEAVNVSGKPVSATARITYRAQDGRRESVEGLWSLNPGPQFIPGGPRKATIHPGKPRLLALAIYSRAQREWMKFGAGYFPPHYRVVEDDDAFWDRTTGERVDLGGTAELSVEISEAGVKRTVMSYRLSFIALRSQKETSVTWRPNAEKLTD